MYKRGLYDKMDEFVQLKWNTHHSTFLENLSSLRDRQVFTDVILSCGDQFYPAHQLVLSSCSTFFSHALEVVKCPSPVLLLHGIEQSTLEELLMFMYDGQVTISRSSLPDLLKAGQWLGVKGLESTFDSTDSNICENVTKSTYLNAQANSSQFFQTCKQFLSFVSTNGKSSGISDAALSSLQQIMNNIIHLGNDVESIKVSKASSVNYNLNYGENSTKLQPDAIEEERESQNLSLENRSLTSHSASLPTLPVHFLDVLCNTREENESENSFEGWGSAKDSEETENLPMMEEERTVELKVLPQYTSCEESSSYVEKENVVSDDQAKSKRCLRCKQCRKTFSVRQDLAKHSRLHHIPQNICITCNEAFTNEKDFKLHMKMHSSNSWHGCSKCDFVSHNKKGLLKHHLSHENNSTQEELFSQSSCIKPEIITEKSPQKDYSGELIVRCSTCHATFENYDMLKKHKLLGCRKTGKHGNSCPICMSSFTRKRSLDDHMSKHTGNYRFCCRYCPYKCSRNYLLEEHIKKKHENTLEKTL